jgi:hypothetical protein
MIRLGLQPTFSRPSKPSPLGEGCLLAPKLDPSKHEGGLTGQDGESGGSALAGAEQPNRNM